MKHNIELLKADLSDELKKIDKMTAEFAEHSDKLSLKAEEISNYDKGAVGFYIHNFYNGCENIFLSIARFF